MTLKITPELRSWLERDRTICAEVPAETPDCRAWVVVYPLFEGDAIERFLVRHFEFRNEWVEYEYDPSGDEMPLDESQACLTELELEACLDRLLPRSATLIRVSDHPDFPG